MDILTSEYWDSFKEIRTDGKKYFNGVRFEKLVRELLLQNFEGTWDSTPVTWDGGKDFVDRSILGKESWAECKMYEKSLSINKISNSLIMAINNQSVNQLLFFSYSPLNQNAIYHLSGFSSATSIKVQVFDDEKLELLILNSKSIAKRFFQNLPKYNLDLQEEILSVFPFFTTDTHIEYSQIKDVEGIHKKRDFKISINTPCLYEIFIRSNSISDKGQLNINLSAIKKQTKPLGVLNFKKLNIDNKGNLKIHFLPGQIYSLKLYLAPIKRGIVTIPPIGINFKKYKKELPSFKVEVTNLNRPSLVGSKILNSLNQFFQTISSGSTISCTVVSGKTGVGKSRFLEESQIRLLTQNFIVLQFDGHADSSRNFNAFSINLVSQIWRLPNTYLLKDSDDINFPKSKKQNTLYDRVCAVLFGSTKKSETKALEIDEIFDLVAHGLSSQRISLIIDNVQGLDALSLELLRRIIKELPGQIGQNAIVLAFNEDELIFSQEATILHQDIKKSVSLNSIIHFIELEEFSKDDVEMFLNTICLSISDKETFTEHYPQLSTLIQENVLPRPLDIYQLFLAAQDDSKKIAFLKDGFFYVNKIEEFHDLVRSVQGKTKKIFELRLNSLKEKIDQLKLLLTLSTLGEVNSALLIKIAGIDETALQYLVNGGWLKYTTGDNINFFHPSIERFVIKIISGMEKEDLVKLFSSSMRADILKNLLRGKLQSEFVLATFYLSAKKSHTLFLKAVNELKHFTTAVPSPRITMQTKAIFNYIIISKNIDPAIYLGFFEVICKLSADGNLKDFTERLYMLKNKLAGFQPQKDQVAYLLFQLIRQYASYTDGLGNPEEGDLILQNEILLISKLPKTIKQKTKIDITVNLLDRRCVCLKNMGNIDEAFKIGMLAFKIAKKNNIHDFACLSLIDVAIIYGDKITNKNKYLRYANRALSYFQKYKKYINDYTIELECIESKAITQCLKAEYEAAIYTADIVIKISRKKNYIHGLLRGLNMKAVFMFQELLSHQEKNESHIIIIKSLLNELEDLSIKTKNVKFYITALHLHAIYFCILNDIAKATEFYKAAIEQFKQLTNDSSSTHLSPSNQALIYNSINFWINHSLKEQFPLDRLHLEQFNLGNASNALIRRRFLKPNMLLFSKIYNFPLF